MEFIKVGELRDVAIGAMKSYSVHGKDIVVANVDGIIYAMDRYCPHAGGDLSKGVLEGCVITCPRHGSKFDLKKRNTMAGPKVAFMKLKTSTSNYYEVKVDDPNLFVEL
jgi:3-phenylpropionate/trans-cinnamate dioxygenase ferredoxin subunit